MEKTASLTGRQAGRRIEWIDILKGIGIILVVLGHIYAPDAVVRKWIYTFHMPLFFFAAGLMYRKKDIFTDIRRRIQTLLVPYIVFAVLTLTARIILFHEPEMGFSELVVSLLASRYKFLQIFNVPLWYIPCFFLSTILFNVLVNIGDNCSNGKKGKYLAYTVSFALSVLYATVKLPLLPWCADEIIRLIAFYAVGVAFSGRKTSLLLVRGNTDDRVLSAAVSAVLIASGIALTYKLGWCHHTAMFFVMAFMGVAASVIISLMIDESTAAKPLSNLLQYCGRISLTILCIHYPVIGVMKKIFALALHTSEDNVRSSILLSLIITVTALSFCVVAHEVIVRVAPWMVGKPVRRSARA